MDRPGVKLLARLEKRRDFLKCARGRKAVRRPFVLQMAPASEPRFGAEVADEQCDGPPRLGFTASRKIGGAVARNRARRRLRAAAHNVMCDLALAGFDYVLVARSAVLTCPFQDLEKDLESALAELSRHRRHGVSGLYVGARSGNSTEA